MSDTLALKESLRQQARDYMDTKTHKIAVVAEGIIWEDSGFDGYAGATIPGAAERLTELGARGHVTVVSRVIASGIRATNRARNILYSEGIPHDALWESDGLPPYDELHDESALTRPGDTSAEGATSSSPPVTGDAPGADRAGDGSLGHTGDDDRRAQDINAQRPGDSGQAPDAGGGAISDAGSDIGHVDPKVVQRSARRVRQGKG